MATHAHPPRDAKIPRTPSSLELDPRIIQEFPTGSECVESVVYGTTACTIAQRISVKIPDGTVQSFFLKSGPGEQGKNMMEAEYLGVKEIHSVMPDFAPKPHAWGKYDLSDVYFLYMDFLDLSQEEMPAPDEYCARLAQLHQTSISPTGQFGFYRTTFQGPIEMNNTWESSWCTFVTRLLTGLFQREITENGSWPEYEQAVERFRTTTIKAVLEPLQAEGRSIKPSLIHGDMWEENAATNLATDSTMIYDCAAFYAHNEFELGMWRGDVYRFGQPYFRQYLTHNPPSEPVEQFDDRNRVYSMKYTLVRLLVYPNQPDRDMLKNDLVYLNQKYAAP